MSEESIDPNAPKSAEAAANAEGYWRRHGPQFQKEAEDAKANMQGAVETAITRERERNKAILAAVEEGIPAKYISVPDDCADPAAYIKATYDPKDFARVNGPFGNPTNPAYQSPPLDDIEKCGLHFDKLMESCGHDHNNPRVQGFFNIKTEGGPSVEQMLQTYWARHPERMPGAGR